MAAQSFKNLVVWEHARAVSLDTHNAFRNCKDYSFRDQIQRASISVMNNIAEGYARRSDKALKNYLSIARGSAAEVESMLLLAADLQYVSFTTQQDLLTKIQVLAKLITAFMNKL